MQAPTALRLSFNSIYVRIPALMVILATVPFWIIALWGVWAFFSLESRIAEIAAGGVSRQQSAQLVAIVRDLQDAAAYAGRAFFIEAVVIAILGAIAVFGVSYYVYRETKRVSKSLLDAVQAIEEGQEEVSPDGGGYEETELLAKAIQEMARIIARQNQALRGTVDDLSIPAIEIWRGVVFMPVVGYVDSRRAFQIEEALLERTVQTKARFVILDISGISSIDTQVMAHILKIIKEIALLGAKAILSGTSPQTARSLVHLGVDLGATEAYGELEAALRRIFADYGFLKKKPEQV
jgi:anti-anti-sigma regulatory factor